MRDQDMAASIEREKKCMEIIAVDCSFRISMPSIMLTSRRQTT
jgi:hypothetical protein